MLTLDGFKQAVLVTIATCFSVAIGLAIVNGLVALMNVLTWWGQATVLGFIIAGMFGFVAWILLSGYEDDDDVI